MHHRAFDQQRVLGHRRNKLGVAEFGIFEAEFVIGCVFPAQQVARLHSHCLQRFPDLGGAWWRFLIIYDFGLDALGADHLQHPA